MLFASNESGFLRILRCFLETRRERRLISSLSESDFFSPKSRAAAVSSTLGRPDSISRTLPVSQTASYHAQPVSCASTYSA